MFLLRRFPRAAIIVGTIWISLGMVATAWAQNYTFTTLAGMPAAGSADGTGLAARFNGPRGAAIDGAGNIYVADRSNHAIRRITPAGVVTTFAGLAGAPGSADGTGSNARFRNPTGIAVDGSGTLYVADRGNHTIRKITPAGVVTTLAGLAGSPGTLGGNGAAARFNNPHDVAVVSTGDVIVADTFSHTIRSITPAGDVSTIAGAAGIPGSTNGTGLASRFNNPQGVAVDSLDAIYVADSANHTIRKIAPGGASVITFAGSPGISGQTNANGTSARFEAPTDIVVDASFNVYVCERRPHVRKITPARDVTTFAGNPGISGTADGTGGAARFLDQVGLAITSNGATLYVTDETAANIRAITVPGAVVTTFAGAAGSFGFADGAGTTARFFFPVGVSVDSAGMLSLTDGANSVIRTMTPSGTVTTLAGTPGTFGDADGTGGTAEFFFPWSSVVDSTGNVFVADSFNHTIRKITPAGVVTTLAGTAGAQGSNDGTGAAARFRQPQGIAIDAAGILYVSDYWNHTIRKITPAGVVSTFAGHAESPGSANGSGGSARFNNPNGIAVDSSGNVYVADSSNATIRKITPAGLVSTLAGMVGIFGSVDATGSAARFSSPSGLAVDASGNVFVAEQDGVIRKITPAGVVTTIAGVFDEVGSSDGVGPAARFSAPNGIAVDGSGTLYIADSGNNTIRKGVSTTAAGDDDYDGDGTADIVVFRPASGTWYTLLSSTGFTGPGTTSQFGLKGDVPVPGDYDGDGTTDHAVYRPAIGTWYVLQSSTDSLVTRALGLPGDLPAPADYDGDGKTDPAVYRPSAGTWHMLRSSAGYESAVQQWGLRGDLPVPGHYDDDNNADVAVYRPSTGRWYVRAGTGDREFQWGLSGDVPVPGDYDGDGITDVAVYRPANGTWFILQSASNFTTSASFQFGLTGDAPVPGDYDGDGKIDLAVFRPSNGTWYIAQSTTSYATSVSFQWGLGGDIPTPNGPIAHAMALYSTLATLVRTSDFDADRRADLTVYRPSTGTWFTRQSSTSFGTSTSYQWGLNNDVPISHDYDGDGQTDFAVYRPSTGFWHILRSSSGYTASTALQWGVAGDLSAPGDYDGDALADPAVFRPSTGFWYILHSSTNHTTSATYEWGVSGDIPVPGDYDGDTISDIAVFRPSNGTWFIRHSTTGYATSASYQWGLPGDIAVPGEYDGDGKTDVAVYRPSNGVWYVLQSSTNYAGFVQFQWGLSNDTPVPADFDGDRKTDLAVWRPSTGTWYVLRSSTNFTTFDAVQWGLSGDVPILKRP